MMSPREQERYKRQMMLFGTAGQDKLAQAHIFIAGAGGLGSPVALYLAAAGVGTITIADMDTVDPTNLNRQILHYDRDTGRKKAASAEEKLRAINPDVTIHAFDALIDASSAAGLVGNADGIVDAMDNYPARYILNATALTKDIPLFHGGIRGFYGQATTVVPGKTACLACIIPKAPKEEIIPVIGATAGVIGAVQATEVLKFLLGTGSLLENRLFLWDGLQACAEELAVERRPACKACGKPAGYGSGDV